MEWVTCYDLGGRAQCKDIDIKQSKSQGHKPGQSSPGEDNQPLMGKPNFPTPPNPNFHPPALEA